MRNKLWINVAILIIFPTPVLAQAVANKPRSKPSPVTVPVVPDKVFDFKGVRLGTTLAEFRTLPHPDGRPARVVCTGEKVGERYYPTEPVDVMLFTDVEKMANIVKCIWVNIIDGKVMNSSTSALDLATSGYVANSYSFKFIKDPADNEFRLYEYSGTSHRNATGSVISALTTKWGAPIIVRSVVQNKMGASFEQITAKWDNSLNQIEIQDRWSKIDDLHISVVDKRLFRVIIASEAERAEKKRNPI